MRPAMRSLVCACVAVAAVSALQPVSRRNGLKHLASGGAALAPLLYPAAAEAAFGKPKALTKKQLAEKEAREKEEAAAAAAAQAAADAESDAEAAAARERDCLLYTSPSPRDATLSRMPSSA